MSLFKTFGYGIAKMMPGFIVGGLICIALAVVVLMTLTDDLSIPPVVMSILDLILYFIMFIICFASGLKSRRMINSYMGRKKLASDN